MFTYEHIQKFNATEIAVYKYIVSNAEKVPFMTIRELSEALHISTSTVLRFCEKIGCNGYNVFEEKIAQAVGIIKECEMVVFIGLGSSGSLAKFAARLFSNLGKFSIALEDMYYPKCINIPLNAVVFALSESGEREELIELISAFQQKNNRIVSITNEADCTLAKMSDWNISYDLNHVYVNGGYNATTQVPVLFILEAISRRI